MPETFFLKNRDTKPKLIVTCINPDGTVHDWTGVSAIKLHIRLQDTSTVLTRAVAIEGTPTLGQVSYQWAASDWDAGNLVPGKHRFEIESTTERLTFPNDAADDFVLIIGADIGQG